MDREKKVNLATLFEVLKAQYLSANKGVIQQEFILELKKIISITEHNLKVKQVVKAIGDELKGDNDYPAMCCHISRLEELAVIKYV